MPIPVESSTTAKVTCELVMFAGVALCSVQFRLNQNYNGDAVIPEEMEHQIRNSLLVLWPEYRPESCERGEWAADFFPDVLAGRDWPGSDGLGHCEIKQCVPERRRPDISEMAEDCGSQVVLRVPCFGDVFAMNLSN